MAEPSALGDGGSKSPAATGPPLAGAWRPDSPFPGWGLLPGEDLGLLETRVTARATATWQGVVGTTMGGSTPCSRPGTAQPLPSPSLTWGWGMQQEAVRDSARHAPGKAWCVSALGTGTGLLPLAPHGHPPPGPEDTLLLGSQTWGVHVLPLRASVSHSPARPLAPACPVPRGQRGLGVAPVGAWDPG